MDYSFGSWIKHRRKALDLSQQELANRVGCSVSAIFKIESDDRRPSRQIAELLAEHLQIPREQHPQFLKVARREKMVESLEPLPVPLEPLVQPSPVLPNSSVSRPLTPLVGREHELNLVVQQLCEPHCRMLTLTGLGGVGKTRLALEAANQLQTTFASGVFFIPLSGISDPGFILPAIANALGLLFSGAGDPNVQLLNYLREKEILLVLDNFEHLLQGSELLIGILQGAPRVKLLVTSRESLNLQAEWIFEVQGLPVPAGDSGKGLQTGSAALLFVQRARQARLNFELTPEENPAVLRICQLVEGLPLGIELAAAWVRTLSCKQISMEIERNLDFLRATARDLPERHRSLRAALDHSWDLLSEPEKEAFRRLSVFRGGFRLEAAQEVAGACLEEIVSLLNKSMVKRVGEERYDLHELVRQYAAARLQSDPQELERTRERYIRYYAGLLDDWQKPLRSPRQLEILGELRAEMDNLRQAWDWMVIRGRFTDIHKSLHCLWHFYEIRGRFQEAESLFGQAVETLQSTAGADTRSDMESQVVFGILLARHGYFCTSLGRHEQASALMHRSLALLRSTTDRVALADTLMLLAYLQYRQGELQQASQSALESLDLNRALDLPLGTAYCLIILSYIHLAQGENEQAYVLSNESLAICRDLLGDPHGTVDSLITLSTAAVQLGKYDQAERWVQEALEISQATNDRWSAGQNLRQLGLIHFELGEAQAAVDSLTQSISKFREAGDRQLMAQTLIDLGVVLRGSGSPSESKQALLEAYRVAVELQILAIAWQALVEMAVSEKEQGKTEQALELVTFVLNNAETDREAKERAGSLKANWATLLTPVQIEAVQARAQERALEDLAQDLLTVR